MILKQSALERYVRRFKQAPPGTMSVARLRKTWKMTPSPTPTPAQTWYSVKNALHQFREQGKRIRAAKLREQWIKKNPLFDAEGSLMTRSSAPSRLARLSKLNPFVYLGGSLAPGLIAPAVLNNLSRRQQRKVVNFVQKHKKGMKIAENAIALGAIPLAFTGGGLGAALPASATATGIQGVRKWGEKNVKNFSRRKYTMSARARNQRRLAARSKRG